MLNPSKVTPDQIKNERARRSLLAFTERTLPHYRAGWFHRLVAEKLDRFLDDTLSHRSPRLILTAPPQHGKSELVSRRLPAFALGRNPDLRIIAASYSADRAFDFSNDVQRIMDSPRYNAIFPESRIVGQFARMGEAKRSAGLFQIAQHAGRYRASGVMGGITGEPADLLIIDDPIKDFSEAISETIRDSVWDWLTSTALTRLQEGAGALMIATRWHLDDPIGRLLARQSGKWDSADFRAIAEEDEPPYRLQGEPLAPERYSLESLLAIRDGGATSSYQWGSLYQQRPSPLGGGIFKRDDFRFYRELPDSFEEVLQSWDCAFKDSHASDFVVGQVWGTRGAERYLLDQIRGRLNFPATLAAIRTLSEKWPTAHTKLVEDKANGSAVIATLQSEIAGIIAVQPEGGKEVRAHAVSSFVEAHNVFFPHPDLSPWVNSLIEECCSFPNGAHDDQVDAMTQALNRTRQLPYPLLAQMKELLAPRKEKQTVSHAKQFTSPSECPECHASCIVQRGLLFHCNACGHEAYLNGMKVQPQIQEPEYAEFSASLRHARSPRL
jgi:predicted phage terminase large subunit-like protein